MAQLCSVENCETKTVGRGLCSRHYQRLRNTGSPTGSSKKSVEQRFWEKVIKSEGCWGWRGAPGPGGYPVITDGTGRGMLSHRYSYALLVGPIPEGLAIDHICHTITCVNPEHLRPVNAKQNAENHQGARANNKSGVLGVYEKRRGSGRWTGEVMHHGKKYRIGVHASVAEAEAAVVELRNKLFTHNDLDRQAA